MDIALFAVMFAIGALVVNGTVILAMRNQRIPTGLNREGGTQGAWAWVATIGGQLILFVLGVVASAYAPEIRSFLDRLFG